MTDKPDHRALSLFMPFSAASISHRLLWGITGLILIGCHATLAWISTEFAYDRPLSEQPVVIMVLIELAAGAVFLVAVWGTALKRSAKGALLPWLICVGIFLRGIMFFSTPMLEHDYYRYLWDGAVLAKGINPYAYSPKQVMEAEEDVPGTLILLARESGNVIERISFPELRTIYPPVAQAAFAASHVLSPWSDSALRIVLAFFDAATLVVLLIILRSLNLPYCLVAVYWWNPLVVREIYNTMHLDVIALPFALAAIALALKGRQVEGAVTLALAVAAKLWPLVLLPVILWSLKIERSRLLFSVGIFGLTTAVLFLPVYMSGLDHSSGFVAYGRYWEMNDAAYRLVSWGMKYVLSTLSLDTSSTQIATRGLVFVALALWIFWLSRKNPADSREIWDRCLLIVAAVFLLSPTGFPWYYLWVVPFLIINLRPSLLLLNCLLPLYYLVYHYRALGHPETFDGVVLWVQYLPFWGLALWEWLASPGREFTETR